MALYLYHAEKTLGWRVMRRIHFDQGEQKVALGVMRRVNDEFGNHIGYQPIVAKESRGDVDLHFKPLPVSITAAQMDINAGRGFKGGQSKTIGFSEEKRLERAAMKNQNTGRQLEAEDVIERVQRKVEVFGHITGAKGDILRVWPHGAAQPLCAQ